MLEFSLSAVITTWRSTYTTARYPARTREERPDHSCGESSHEKNYEGQHVWVDCLVIRRPWIFGRLIWCSCVRGTSSNSSKQQSFLSSPPATSSIMHHASAVAPSPSSSSGAIPLDGVVLAKVPLSLPASRQGNCVDCI